MESPKIENYQEILNFLENKSFDIKKIFDFVTKHAMKLNEQNKERQQDAAEALILILNYYENTNNLINDFIPLLLPKIIQYQRYIYVDTHLGDIQGGKNQPDIVKLIVSNDINESNNVDFTRVLNKFLGNTCQGDYESIILKKFSTDEYDRNYLLNMDNLFYAFYYTRIHLKNREYFDSVLINNDDYNNQQDKKPIINNLKTHIKPNTEEDFFIKNFKRCNIHKISNNPFDRFALFTINQWRNNIETNSLVKLVFHLTNYLNIQIFGESYDLIAVIFQHGNYHEGGGSGHYVAYVHNNKEWLLCDDSRISSGLNDNKLKDDKNSISTPYILLYEKTKNKFNEFIDYKKSFVDEGGLPNLGVSCFLNSLLQLLRRLYISYSRKIPEKDVVPPTKITAKSSVLLEPVHGVQSFKIKINNLEIDVVNHSIIGTPAIPVTDNVYIVDPAGLGFINSGPSGADGASGSIYNIIFTDINVYTQFSENVKNNIKNVSDAVSETYTYTGTMYNNKWNVIHVIGPDGNDAIYKQLYAFKDALKQAYVNVFKIFFKKSTENSELWLLPISSSIFAGVHQNSVLKITLDVLEDVLKELRTEINGKKFKKIKMCFYKEDDFNKFKALYENKIGHGHGHGAAEHTNASKHYKKIQLKEFPDKYKIDDNTKKTQIIFNTKDANPKILVMDGQNIGNSSRTQQEDDKMNNVATTDEYYKDNFFKRIHEACKKLLSGDAFKHCFMKNTNNKFDIPNKIYIVLPDITKVSYQETIINKKLKWTLKFMKNDYVVNLQYKNDYPLFKNNDKIQFVYVPTKKFSENCLTERGKAYCHDEEGKNISVGELRWELDDLFVMMLACALNAIVVSNDNYQSNPHKAGGNSHSKSCSKKNGWANFIDYYYDIEKIKGIIDALDDDIKAQIQKINKDALLQWYLSKIIYNEKSDKTPKDRGIFTKNSKHKYSIAKASKIDGNPTNFEWCSYVDDRDMNYAYGHILADDDLDIPLDTERERPSASGVKSRVVSSASGKKRVGFREDSVDEAGSVDEEEDDKRGRVEGRIETRKELSELQKVFQKDRKRGVSSDDGKKGDKGLADSKRGEEENDGGLVDVNIPGVIGIGSIKGLVGHKNLIYVVPVGGMITSECTSTSSTEVKITDKIERSKKLIYQNEVLENIKSKGINPRLVLSKDEICKVGRVHMVELSNDMFKGIEKGKAHSLIFVNNPVYGSVTDENKALKVSERYYGKLRKILDKIKEKLIEGLRVSDDRTGEYYIIIPFISGDEIGGGSFVKENPTEYLGRYLNELRTRLVEPLHTASLDKSTCSCNVILYLGKNDSNYDSLLREFREVLLNKYGTLNKTHRIILDEIIDNRVRNSKDQEITATNLAWYEDAVYHNENSTRTDEYANILQETHVFRENDDLKYYMVPHPEFNLEKIPVNLSNNSKKVTSNYNTSLTELPESNREATLYTVDIHTVKLNRYLKSLSLSKRVKSIDILFLVDNLKPKSLDAKKYTNSLKIYDPTNENIYWRIDSDPTSRMQSAFHKILYIMLSNGEDIKKLDILVFLALLESMDKGGRELHFHVLNMRADEIVSDWKTLHQSLTEGSKLSEFMNQIKCPHRKKLSMLYLLGLNNTSANLTTIAYKYVSRRLYDSTAHSKSREMLSHWDIEDERSKKPFKHSVDEAAEEAEEARKRAEEAKEKAEEADKKKKRKDIKAKEAGIKAEEAEIKAKEAKIKEENEEAEEAERRAKEAKEKAEEEKKRAEEAERKAEEAKKKLEEAERMAEEKKRKAEKAKEKAEEETKKKAEEAERKAEEAERKAKEAKAAADAEAKKKLKEAKKVNGDKGKGKKKGGGEENASEKVGEDGYEVIIIPDIVKRLNMTSEERFKRNINETSRYLSGMVEWMTKRNADKRKIYVMMTSNKSTLDALSAFKLVYYKVFRTSNDPEYYKEKAGLHGVNSEALSFNAMRRRGQLKVGDEELRIAIEEDKREEENMRKKRNLDVGTYAFTGLVSSLAGVIFALVFNPII